MILETRIEYKDNSLDLVLEERQLDSFGNSYSQGHIILRIPRESGLTLFSTLDSYTGRYIPELQKETIEPDLNCQQISRMANLPLEELPRYLADPALSPESRVMLLARLANGWESFEAKAGL